MNLYISKYDCISGSSYTEVMAIARKHYHTIQKQTKRMPYVRSTYFRKDKIFLDTFWNHLRQKRRSDQTRRLKLYVPAIDLLRNARINPETISGGQAQNMLFHRFAGKTKSGELFYVQVKQDKKSGRKDFMSVFPAG